MILYMIRHGQARDDSPTGHDCDRPLVAHGREQADAIAEFLSETAHTSPALVLSSPYIRARQTGAPIWSQMDQLEQIDDRLGADRSVSDILDVIPDAGDAQAIAIISHNPIISRAIDVLIAGIEAPRLHSMRTGELIGLQIDPNEPIGSGQIVTRFRLGD